MLQPLLDRSGSGPYASLAKPVARATKAIYPAASHDSMRAPKVSLVAGLGRIPFFVLFGSSFGA